MVELVVLLSVNGDIVEQSLSKGVYCSETFRPRGCSLITKQFSD